MNNTRAIIPESADAEIRRQEDKLGRKLTGREIRDIVSSGNVRETRTRKTTLAFRPTVFKRAEQRAYDKHMSLTDYIEALIDEDTREALNKRLSDLKKGH